MPPIPALVWATLLTLIVGASVSLLVGTALLLYYIVRDKLSHSQGD